MVEISLDSDWGTPRRAEFDMLVNDRHYNDLKATDGTDISSRAKHREYMKRNNLATADDFKETWKRAEAQREAYYQGKGQYAVTGRDIAQAIEQLKSKGRR